MEELKKDEQVNTTVGNQEKVTYQEILDGLKRVHNEFMLDSEEMVKVFNEKYANEGVIQLLDEKGEALKDKEGNRIEPVLFEKIDDKSKQAHIRGLLYSLTQNPVNFTSKVLKEKEILEAVKTKGFDLKGMIEKYREDNNIQKQ